MNPTKYFTTGVMLLWCCLFSLKAIAQMEWQQTNYTQDTKINDFLSWNDADTLFAATYNEGIQMTTDSGESWQTLNNGLSDLNVQALVKKDSLLFAGTFNHGVFISSDKGQNWQSVTDSILNPYVWSMLLRDNRLFAGTELGIYYTDNNGTNWQKATLPPRKAHHRVVFCLAANEEKIIGGTSHYVYESPNNGDNWIQYRVPTESGVFSAVNYQGDILLGTGGDGVLYPTTGSGYSAVPAVIDDHLGVNILSLYEDGVNLISSLTAVNGSDIFLNAISIDEGLEEEQAIVSQLINHQGTLYAGTFDHGIWKYELIPPPLIESPEETTPATDFLDWTSLSVFPNPAGGVKEMVQLQYHVPEDGVISLDLFRENGQHVSTLIQSFELQGDYQIQFDMSQLENGNYYFAYRMGQSIIARPVFLIR